MNLNYCPSCGCNLKIADNQFISKRDPLRHRWDLTPEEAKRCREILDGMVTDGTVTQETSDGVMEWLLIPVLTDIVRPERAKRVHGLSGRPSNSKGKPHWTTYRPHPSKGKTRINGVWVDKASLNQQNRRNP